MYALIYGCEWEDVMYFGDLFKAKFRLVMQTKYGNQNFRPFIQKYILVLRNGLRTNQTTKALETV